MFSILFGVELTVRSACSDVETSWPDAVAAGHALRELTPEEARTRLEAEPGLVDALRCGYSAWGDAQVLDLIAETKLDETWSVLEGLAVVSALGRRQDGELDAAFTGVLVEALRQRGRSSARGDLEEPLRRLAGSIDFGADRRLTYVRFVAEQRASALERAQVEGSPAEVVSAAAAVSSWSTYGRRLGDGAEGIGLDLTLLELESWSGALIAHEDLLVPVDPHARVPEYATHHEETARLVGGASSALAALRREVRRGRLEADPVSARALVDVPLLLLLVRHHHGIDPLFESDPLFQVEPLERLSRRALRDVRGLTDGEVRDRSRAVAGLVGLLEAQRTAPGAGVVLSTDEADRSQRRAIAWLQAVTAEPAEGLLSQHVLCDVVLTHDAVSRLLSPAVVKLRRAEVCTPRR
jgi:hypothetical protein